MKKSLKVVALLVAMLAMSLFLTACGSSYGKIESALEENGYKKVETSSQGQNVVEESDVAVTAHFFTKEINLVLVLEFKATEDMKEFYADSETMQGLLQDIQDEGSAEEFYQALEDAGLAKGNCLVLCLNPLYASAVADIVKNA